jgi:hypothetical protein
MIFDPQGLITRPHFYGYRPHCDAMMPPPMHVESMNPAANWAPLPRPLAAGGDPGPSLIIGGTGMPCLGIDPTDPLTWTGRGYRQSAGMIGRFNAEADWRGNTATLNPLGMGS